MIANASSAGDSAAATIDVAEQMNIMFEQLAEMKSELVGVKGDLAAANGRIDGLTDENADLKTDNAALKARVFDLETAAAANTGSSSGTSSNELAAVQADLATLAANHTKDMAALSESFSKGIVELEDHLAEVNTSYTTLTTTMSNVVYADDVHPGGDLDFTEGSASLAILKQTLPGVKVFLGSIYIKGSNVKGSVVSELLKDAAVVGGGLYCDRNQQRFAADDDELVFASLKSVIGIWMYDNNNPADSAGRYTSPSSVSFPALAFIPGNIKMHDSKYKLETISMPKLVGVGGSVNFGWNDVMTSLQLPSLLNVGSSFQLQNLPKLTAGGVKVSQQFKSVGGTFSAYTSDGFTLLTCTTDNGLKAVVQGASSIDSDSRQIASCKK